MKNYLHKSGQITSTAVKLILSLVFIFQLNSVISQNSDQLRSLLEKYDTHEGLRECVFPPEWNQPTPSDMIHGIIVPHNADITINGIRVNPGDVLGAFYLDENGNQKCGGADCFVSGTNIIFPVYADNENTPEKDGFVYGEIMNFKLFSWPCAGGTTIEVDSIAFDTSSYPSTDIWYPLGLSMVKYISAHTNIDCQLQLSDNNSENNKTFLKAGWNTIIYNGVEISIDDYQYADEIIIIKEVKGAGIYWPQEEVNTLKVLIPGKEYEIKVSKDCKISF